MSELDNQNIAVTENTSSFNLASYGIEDTPNGLFNYLTGNSPAPSMGHYAPHFVSDLFSQPRSYYGSMSSMSFLKDNEGFKQGLYELVKDPNFNAEDFEGSSIGSLEGVFNRINSAGPAVQSAMNSALSNPEFLKHIAKGGAGDLLNEETINSVLTGEHATYAVQLLNQIGTNEIFRGEQAAASFARVDTLAQDIQKYGQASKEEREAKSEAERTAARNKMTTIQTAMVDNMRNLGVNVPEDVSPEILDAMKSIFLHGVPTEQAMDELMIKLAQRGIDPEAIRSMDAMMRPMAGMMDYIAQPYGEFFRKHGASIGGFVNDTIGHADNINRGILNGEGFATSAAQREQNVQSIVDTINARRNPQPAATEEISPAQRAQNELSAQANQPGAMQDGADVRGEGLNGVEQRVDTTTQMNGAANDDVPQTIDPALAGQQLNQTRSLGMGVGGP